MEDLYNKAKDYAFKLLTYRPRSKKEIRDKLIQRQYPLEIVDRVICMLEEFSFVNDREFAQLWIQNRCKTKPTGGWRLKQELLSKGIDVSIIEEKLAALMPKEKEIELAEKLVNTKKGLLKADRKKVYAFLKRRGFSNDTINQILSLENMQ